MTDEEREDRNQKVCQAYRDGVSYRKIAKDFAISPATIQAVLKRYGVTLNRRMKEAERLVMNANVCKAYKAGWTFKRIREEYGVSNGVIVGVLNRAGIMTRRKKLLRNAKRRDKRIAQAYDTEDVTTAELAKRFKVSKRTVTYAIAKHEVYRYKPRAPAKNDPTSPWAHD